MNEQDVKRIVNTVLKTSFAQKRVGDTPTDNLQLVNRKYVNLNGSIAGRPASVTAVIGQQYYASDIAIPLVYDGAHWRNGVGSIIASN